MRTIDTVVIHAAATPPSMDIGAKEIDKWHRDPPRNWSRIGYHYVIRRNGVVEEGRPLSVPGAHVRGHNKTSIGICLVGGLNEEDRQPENNFTPDQFTALGILLEDLEDDFGALNTLGHRDIDSHKDCPCFNVADWLINK